MVLADPNAAIRSSIAALARTADVSEPTVNRFCRSLDCSGFPDFKLRVAQSLASGTPYVNSNVEADTIVVHGIYPFLVLRHGEETVGLRRNPAE